MKKSSFLSLVAAASIWVILSFFGEASANVIPGTIVTGNFDSPTRSCTVDTVWGTIWPQYNCQEVVSAGCKIYNNNASLNCSLGNSSNTATPDSNCSDSSSGLCAGSCLSTSTYSCTNSSTVPSCNADNHLACDAGDTWGTADNTTTPNGTSTRYCTHTTYGTEYQSPAPSCTNSTAASCTIPLCGAWYSEVSGTRTSNTGTWTTNTMSCSKPVSTTSAANKTCTNVGTVPACSPSGCGSWSQVSVGTSTTPGATNTRTCQKTTYPDSTGGTGTPKTCKTYYTAPVIYNQITKQRFSDNLNQTFQFWGSNLGVEAGNTCEVDAYRDTYLALGYNPPTSSSITCERGIASTGYSATVTTWNGGNDGTCRYVNTDYQITGYDQVVGKKTIANPQPTGTSRTCNVMWLTATVDNTGPTISVNNVSSLFDGEQDNWCNYTKYADPSYAAGSLAGCEYYRSKISNDLIGGNHPDLLQNLEINVDDPSSGISEVRVEIGKCDATYSFNTAVADLVVSPTAPSGTKADYKNITFYYKTPSTSAGGAPGAGKPSLLNLFNVTRLDSCLVEGKNYIRVTAKDNARSDADGVSYAPNSTVFSYESQGKFLKVDNSTAKIGLSGNAAKIFDSNAANTCFAGGGVTKDSLWKNFTITGNLKSTDPFGNDATDCIPDISGGTGSTTETRLTCLTNLAGIPKPAASWVTWTAPTGVNPTTGTFTGKTVGGIGPIPNLNSCVWGCPSGFQYDTTSNSCIVATYLFILMNDATHPLAAKLTNNVNTSHGLLKQEAGPVCPLPPVGDGVTKQYYSFSYLVSNPGYSFPTAPIGPFQIQKLGLTACIPPPPPPTYEYQWVATAWDPCHWLCGVDSNGVDKAVRDRTVVCRRFPDHVDQEDSKCTGPKPAKRESCSIPCASNYRTRLCELATQAGPSLGYDATNTGTIQSGSPQYCDIGTLKVLSGATATIGGKIFRCDIRTESEVDVNLPLPDAICPSNICKGDGKAPCIVGSGSTQVPQTDSACCKIVGMGYQNDSNTRSDRNEAWEYGYPYAILNQACLSQSSLPATFVYNGRTLSGSLSADTSNTVACPLGITGTCYKSMEKLEYFGIADARIITPITDVVDSTCTPGNKNPHFCFNGASAGSLEQQICAGPASLSCASPTPTAATIPNIWATSTWATVADQPWTYSATPGNCTYQCTGGYSGSGCLVAPSASPNYCAAGNTVSCVLQR